MYYSVNLMYKSERTDSEPPLWEERIILVSAMDEIEAEEKAKASIVANECEFTVSDSVSILTPFED